MRKLIAIWVLLVAGLISRQIGAFPGQSPFGPGLNHSIAAAGVYSGPGDVVSGWKAFWGLRAFRAATVGNRVARVCDNTGANCTDFVTDTSGNLIFQTLGSNNCASTSTCLITTLYDQSGANNCAGSTACDIVQATAAKMPVLIANCIGSKPCARMVNASQQSLTASANMTAVAQPWTGVWAAKRTALTSYAMIITDSTNAFTGFDSAANGVTLYATGSVKVASATDNQSHSVSAVANNAGGSVIFVDGNAGTSAAGAGAVGIGGAPIAMCNSSGTNFCTADYYESGINHSAFSQATSQSVCNNQYTYWGLTNAC